MVTGLDSSASKSEGLAPTPISGSWATSGSDPGARKTGLLPELLAELMLGERVGIVDSDTTLDTNITKHFDSGHSSSAFASDGLVRTTLQAYSARINALRNFATQDGYALNPASESDFRNFIELEPRWRKGNLVLIDNGNLRAIWKDGQGTRLGLQFLGSGMVQFVIFKQREATRPISRVAGRDTFAGLRQQIDVFELGSLLYE